MLYKLYSNLFFSLILDLQKNQEDSMEHSIIPLSSFPYY